MPQLFKSVFGFFRPKRAEILIILTGLFLMSAVIVPELVSISLPYGETRETSLWNFALLLVLGVSIGAGLGTFRWSELRRNRWFVMAVVFVPFFCGFLLYRENLLFRGSNDQRSLGIANSQSIQWVLEGWLLCLLGTSGAWAITKSSIGIIDVVSQKFPTLSRQRLMVGIAIVLFICLTTRNILDKSDVRFGQFNWNSNPILQVLIGACVILFGAALPAWVISKIRGGWALVISMVYLATLAGLSASFVSMPTQFLIGFYALVFSCVVVAVTSYRGLSESSEVCKKAPGFWGLGIMAIALLTTVVFWNFSLNGLLFGGSNRFELARQIKQLSSCRGVESQFVIYGWKPWLVGNGPVQVFARIRFQPNTDQNCLKILADSPSQFFLDFETVSPGIETSYIRNVSKSQGSISNSRITYQQLADIVGGSSAVSIVNCEFVESNDVKDSGKSTLNRFKAIGRFQLNDMPVDETGNFLAHIDVTKFAGSVAVGSTNKLSEGDWQQIIDRSLHFPITVHQRPPQNVIDEAVKLDLPADLYLDLYLGGDSMLDRNYWNLVLNTQFNVQINLPRSDDDMEKFWDAAFASRGTRWADIVFKQLEDPRFDVDLREIAKIHHWIFDEDEYGEPNGALLPFGGVHLDQVSKWNGLTSLSLDARWIESLKNYDDRDIPKPRDISALGNLTNLKRLDLPSGLWGADFAFLKKLPELEHLQFDVHVDGSKNVNFGFLASDCPNLRSLVLLGKPPKALALEIAKLPKLESVKLIDFDQTLINEGQRKMIQKTIGKNILLTIVPFDKDRPDVPAEFVEHVKKVREAVRERYLSGDGQNED